MKAAKIRPITIMAVLGLLGLAAAAVYAWGPGGTSKGPRPLPVAVSSASAASGAARPDIAVMPGQPFARTVFVAAPDLPPLDGTAHAWRLAGPAPDASMVARLGAALGLHGTPERAPDGGWTIGPTTGPNLRISAMGVQAWSWSYASSATVSSPPVACARPLPSASAIGPDQGVLSVPCGVAPPKPVDVPSATEAESQVRGLLGRAGIDLQGWKVTASSNDYTAMVTAAPVLDGLPVQGLSIDVTLGSHATVTYASGFVGTPERMDLYPLIGTGAAVTQLGKGEELGTGVEPMMGLAVPAATTTTMATVSTTTTVAASTPGSAVSNPGAAGAGTGTTGSIGQGPTVSTVEPVPTTTLAPVTVTIDRAQLVLSAQIGTDGAMWLVPAYQLGTRDGGSWTVLAVERRFVAPTPVIRPPVATIESPGSAVSPGSSAGSSRGSTGSVGGSEGTTASTTNPPTGG